ncbi:hypothetical protein F4809DRAFT_599286 [Biscogniauxia mediterranea]|nr:hypothetical protein F4809DRAFT_599286 [Biscogniauxia mediterranea]
MSTQRLLNSYLVSSTDLPQPPNDPRIDQYIEVWQIARMVVENGGQLDLEQVINGLRQDINNNVAVADSQTAKQVQVADLSTRMVQMSIPVTVPPQLNAQQAEVLNPTGSNIASASLAPPERPPSPGPLRPVFAENTSENIWSNDNPHPNPQALPAMRNVHLFGPTVNTPEAETCQALTRRNSPDGEAKVCGAWTKHVCEDTTHGMNPARICDDCSEESITAWEESFHSIVDKMRTYACQDCTQNASDPSMYYGLGVRVWGLPPFDKHADYPGSSAIINTPPSSIFGAPYNPSLIPQTKGGFMGPLLPWTGCSCAQKFCSRRLCKPHRFANLVKVVDAAARTEEYVRKRYGQEVCFYCQVRPSIRLNPGFADMQKYMYACTACQEIVVTGPGGHERLATGKGFPVMLSEDDNTGSPGPDPGPQQAEPSWSPLGSLWGSGPSGGGSPQQQQEQQQQQQQQQQQEQQEQQQQQQQQQQEEQQLQQQQEQLQQQQQQEGGAEGQSPADPGSASGAQAVDSPEVPMSDADADADADADDFDENPNPSPPHFFSDMLVEDQQLQQHQPGDPVSMTGSAEGMISGFDEDPGYDSMFVSGLNDDSAGDIWGGGGGGGGGGSFFNFDF